MRTSTKIVATLGVVSGLGASILPFGTIAALDPTTTTDDDSANVTFNATVSPSNSISLDEPSKSVNVTPNDSSISEATTEITTTSNLSDGYRVTVYATSTVTKDGVTTAAMKNGNTASILTSNDIGQGKEAWAIKTAVTGYADTWQAIPATTAGALNAVVTSGPSATNGDVNTVTWGVTAGSSTVAATYYGTVVFTITAKS